MALGSVLVRLAPQLIDLIDKVVPTEQGRQEAKLKLMELEQKGQLAQVEVNANEAQHQSLFVAGWRPFIGWVCGASFAWLFVFQPMLAFALAAVGFPPIVVPFFDMDAVLYVLVGILGLGGLRTYEKKSGISNELPAVTTRDNLSVALNEALKVEPEPTPVDRKAKR